MSLKEFVYEQRRDLPLLVTGENCAGKTFIVTGANIGIGLEVARHLVRASASRVIMGVRNAKAGTEALASVEKTTGRHGVAEVWPLDLASYDSVKSFAKRATAELTRIDGMVQNAAAGLEKWSVAEGMETSMTVNVFGTLLLGVLLIPKLIECGRHFDIQPRLVFVVSGLGFQRQKELERFQGDVFGGLADESKADMVARYGLTKLVQMYAIRELAALAPPERTGIIINMISPGLCKTGLTRHATFKTRVTMMLFNALLGRTAEMGSRSVLHALVGDASTHGKYLSDCAIKDYQVPQWMTDENGQRMQKEVWNGITEKLEKVEPGCFLRFIPVKIL